MERPALLYTHTMSLAFLKNKRGKYIYVYFILVTTAWLTSKFYPCILPCFPNFSSPFTTILLTHGGSRQLPFLLNVYHKVTHTYNVQNWAWTLLLLCSLMLNMYLACHITYCIECGVKYITSILSKTPLFSGNILSSQIVIK